MTTRVRKAVDWTVGLALIGFGIVGGFLPVVQGWVFVVAGLAVLSSHSAFAKRVNDRLKSGVRRVRDRVAARRESSAGKAGEPD